MEPECSLQCSQELATGPYRDPDKSIAHISTPFRQKYILVISSHLRRDLPSRSSFPSGFSTKTSYAFIISPLCATCPAHLILELITPNNKIWWSVQIMKLVIIQCVQNKNEYKMESWLIRSVQVNAGMCLSTWNWYTATNGDALLTKRVVLPRDGCMWRYQTH
jgi:hypothetical protein